MSATRLPAPAELISHRGDAILLDEVLAVGDDRLEGRLLVRPGTAFSEPSGDLPGWVGPEIMAQAIAALSGYRWQRTRGVAAPIGLLLGVRSYDAAVAGFRCGDTLHVEVVESTENEDGRAVFDGRIRRGDEIVASGTLTVFQPPDDSFLEAELTRHE
jgi:predicted hotdog family 3-hydroxylacyl-ACP dehydratase